MLEKDQYFLLFILAHTEQTDVSPKVWERNREEKDREGRMGINIALWPLKCPSALQKSSKHSLVSFLTNPKGQPSCFLLLLYESRLASTSIFMGQFDVCSHHLMKPRCCCSLFQRVDVTGMWTNPKVVSADKELCLTASLGNVNQFPTQGFPHKASHFFGCTIVSRSLGCIEAVEWITLVIWLTPCLLSSFTDTASSYNTVNCLLSCEEGGRNLQARLDSWFSEYHITVQCSCSSSSFASPPFSSSYTHISTFPSSRRSANITEVHLLVSAFIFFMVS